MGAQTLRESPRTGQIIVDWGTSNFRAYRFGPDDTPSARHQADAGILSVQDGAFEDVLEREIGGWFGAGTPILLSGMITSRNGWVETPYVEAPASLAALAAGAVVRHSRRGALLKFLPGVATRQPRPDVMRGEEIQIFGTITPGESATVVLPGTHSKWARVTDGILDGFRTFLTGESYALLRTHSILGRLIPPGPQGFDEAAFRQGVRMACDADSISLLNDIFTTRAGVLLGSFGAEDIAERLSGILIGHEIKAGLGKDSTGKDRSGLHAGGRLVLVGEEALTRRYQVALDVLGQSAEIGPTDATAIGFRRLAQLPAG